MSCTEVGVDDKGSLRAIASRSILYGLEFAKPLLPDIESVSQRLSEPGASFVTLMLHGHLCGCIGSLEAHKPLATDVADNAFSAAFRDPRFEALDRARWSVCEFEISVLSQPEILPIATEDELLERLRPGVDGLILKWQNHRATFLPSVWASLSTPKEFVAALKLKAGLSRAFWDQAMEVLVYQTQKF